MSDLRLPPYSPFAPLRVSFGESVGSHGSQNLSSHPVDHRSQVSRPFQRSSSGNGAQHSCGTPHLSLHGFGHPRTSSTVFGMSHGDYVQTIQERQPGTMLPISINKATRSLDPKIKTKETFMGLTKMAKRGDLDSFGGAKGNFRICIR